MTARAAFTHLETPRLVLRRVGPRREAHFRENTWFKGAWGDELL